MADPDLLLVNSSSRTKTTTAVMAQIKKLREQEGASDQALVDPKLLVRLTRPIAAVDPKVHKKLVALIAKLRLDLGYGILPDPDAE